VTSDEHNDPILLLFLVDRERVYRVYTLLPDH